MDTQKLQTIGAIVVSSLVTIAAILIVYEAYEHGDQHTIDVMTGGVMMLFASVVAFWVGSSMRSQGGSVVVTPPSGEIPPPPKAV